MHAIETTLVQRIAEKNVPVITLMLNQSDALNLNVNARVGQETILHEAVRSGEPEIVNLMLFHPHIDTTHRSYDDETRTAFHLACELGNAAVVECFIRYFDANAKNEEKYLITKNAKTALMLAAEFGDATTCELLLQQKVNVRAATLEGQNALDFAIARVKADHHDPKAIAVLKVLLMYGAAFCRDVSALEDVIAFLDETEKCYFFETTLRGNKLTAECRAFVHASFFDLSNDPEVKLICHDRALFPHFSLRCMEFELNPPENDSAQAIIEKSKKMRRIFDLNKSGFSLQTLLSQQYGQQLLRGPLSEPIREVVAEGAREGDAFSRDYEMCRSRIVYLSQAIKEMERSQRKKYGFSLALSLVLLGGAIVGLVFGIRPDDRYSGAKHTLLQLTGALATIIALFWFALALKGLGGECVSNKLPAALNDYMTAERERDERHEGLQHHQLTQYEDIDRGTTEAYLRELKLYFAELEANPASLHTSDNAMQGILRAETRVDVVSDSEGEDEQGMDQEGIPLRRNRRQ